MANFRIKNINMTDGPIFSSIVRYSVPIVLGGVLQILFNAADLAVVGNFSQSKTAAAAAVGATSSIISLIVNLFMGLSVGVNVILARSIGADNREKSERIVHTAIVSSFILGIFVGVVGYFISDFAMTAMDCPEASLEMAVQYMKIYFIGAPGIMLYNFGAAILRTNGDTQRPLNFLIVAGVLNVILNIIFVYFFKMEAAGVALATTLTQYLSAYLTLRCLAYQTDCTRLDFKKLKIHRREMIEIFKYGMPTGITNAMFSVANIQIQSALNAYDIAAINGSSAIGSLEGFIAAGTNAFNAAAVAFVGQNIGAEKKERVMKCFYACMISAVVFAAVVGNVMYLFCPQLVRFYNSSDPEVIHFGILRAKIMLRFYFLYGFSSTLNGTLQAFGHSSAVMANSIISICGLRTVWMQVIYPMSPSYSMLYWCYPLSMLAISVVDAVILFFVYRRYRKEGSAIK